MSIKSKYTSKDVSDPTAGENQYVTLPFPALRLNWFNGVPQNKAFKDTRHFGGWFAGSDKVAEDLPAMGVDALPAQFGQGEEFVARAGESFNAYEARFLYVAPICLKDDWYSELNDQGVMAKRHRIDLLSLLGTHVKGQPIMPWGAAVLSAKGFAATAVVQAMRAFVKVTADVRRVTAKDVPTMFFYVPIGTFGDKLITAPAGNSIYTPAQIMPVEWDEAALEALYVDDEAWQDALVNMQADAKSWLADTRGKREKTAVNTEDVGGVVPEGDYPDEIIDGSLSRQAFAPAKKKLPFD